ncbi:MAG: hypothetical protein JNK30_15715 [Phenylobacterium sp.]|uniref:hypothetical protein n=1 Tax=Phenylobacterium sp. TaxID=1871053 RepID=UPI001A5EA368|nr:hypothetical protein [Phenylobacterium sp.]MBL8772829.1 hypothetical protein [Phenylobacterium sp.]
MFKLIAGRAPVPSRTEPTALLKMIAGEFAPAIARAWPEPHCGFLTAPAARRHLACVALALGGDVARLAGVLGEARTRDVIRVALGRHPPGLERALGRLGETAWSADAYRRLIDLLADPKAGKILRHAGVIDRAAIERLGRLPAPMGRALALALLIADDGARAVCEAADAIAFRDGPDAADAAAGRWAEAETEEGLFAAVKVDLYPELPPLPFAGTERLKPLATKAAMREAARRFGNCLADRVEHAAAGWSAYYEWTEDEGAIAEVTRDAIHGWRLSEAKGPKNEPLDKDARAALVGELTAMGVYVGRNSWKLERALTPGVGRDWPLPSIDEDLAEVFG